MDAVEVVARRFAAEWLEHPNATKVDAEVAISALLAKGNSDPVALMPADEDGVVELRRAENHSYANISRRDVVINQALVPIEDGEG